MVSPGSLIRPAALHPRGRGVTAVLGPTNTGKTHLAIERMLGHDSGLIGLPLRLLAREVYQRLVERAGVGAVALITGEVSGEAAREAVAKAVAGVENVRSVVNELVVAPSTTLGERTADSVLTGRVKASFVEAADVPAAAFKVVTERGVVYLMGRVTEGEAARATERARSVTNVKKVVRLMEILSEAEAAALVKSDSAAKKP